MRVLIVISLAAIAGCFPDSTWQCDTDGECSTGEVCARSHECLLPNEVRAVRVHWTIEGQTDTATACGTAGIDHMAISFEASQGDQLGFSPVPCSGGLFPMDKLPVRMTTVDVRGQAADNRALFHGTATIAPDVVDLTIDLLPAY